MIFKKKYKRSSWMEGLLVAEACMHKGYSREEVYAVTSTERRYGKDGVVFYSFGGNSGISFKLGVIDYLKHFEENKEILSKWLDK